MMDITPSNFISGIIWTVKLTNMPQYSEMLNDFSDVRWSWIISYKWCHMINNEEISA